jgi:toxin ParE1/3/4
MAYRVVYRPQAIRDLNSIVDYIARDNRPRAISFAKEIRQFCRNLRFFPLRGRPRDEIEPGLRTLSYRGRVIVAYRVDGDRVLISNIFYAGRDYEAILRSQGKTE